MKGYITNSKCYIFPQEAAQIPEVEADVIYVQEENYAAWVAANESLADKLVKYNYNVMTVKEKEWAGHTDDDLEPVQKEDPELAWSVDAWEVTIGADDNIYAELSNPHSVSPIVYSSSDTAVATINESTGQVTLVAAGVTNLTASFAGDDTYEAQTVTYALTVNAAQPETYSFTINISNEESPINVGSYAEGAEVTYTFDSYFPTDLSQTYIQSIDPEIDYNFNPGSSVWDEESGQDVTENASISFTMPAADVTFELVYVPLYEVTVNDESAGSYAEGSTVNISIPGPVDSITPNDLEYTYDSGTGDFSFTMPAEPVYIYTTSQELDPENPE